MNSTYLLWNKINMRKLIAFLYTSNQKEKIKTNPVLNHIKKKKIPRNKLDQKGERPIFENYKTLINQIEDDTKKCKDILCSLK